jgi:predicted RNase H-like nuclease (RuvC/YqgF family)
MSKETEQPTEPTQNDAAELATLRTTVGELKQKSATRKQRIAELEAANAELQAKVTEANASLRQITIDRPIKQMSESISTAPELWTEQFSKAYRLELVNGDLTLHSTDGQPVTKEGKAIPFEREALVALLTDEKHPQAKAFRAITIASRASGGAAPTRSATSAPKQPDVQFGLR